MRKNTARHWLHACLDLLPVLLIPVFMIYSHRHTIDSGSIQVQEKVSVDFNQLRVDSKEFSNVGLNISVNESSIYFSGTASLSTTMSTIVGGEWTKQNHYYLFRLGDYDVTPRLSIYMFSNQGSGSAILQRNFGSLPYDLGYIKVQAPVDNASLELGISVVNGTTYDDGVSLNIFDLTQLGLEDISFEDFNALFPNENYKFVSSQKELINGNLVTYDDNDIMSQFTYQMYNAVDKYFNMGNVFGMNNVYQWFELNIFGGSAPLYIYIVWQIVLYEFVMDLLFLLYALFMWFIDVTKRLIEKPLDSIK